MLECRGVCEIEGGRLKIGESRSEIHVGHYVTVCVGMYQQQNALWSRRIRAGWITHQEEQET